MNLVNFPQSIFWLKHCNDMVRACLREANCVWHKDLSHRVAVNHLGWMLWTWWNYGSLTHWWWNLPLLPTITPPVQQPAPNTLSHHFQPVRRHCWNFDPSAWFWFCTWINSGIIFYVFGILYCLPLNQDPAACCEPLAICAIFTQGSDVPGWAYVGITVFSRPFHLLYLN